MPYIVPPASSTTHAGMPAASRAIRTACASVGLKKLAMVTVGSDSTTSTPSGPKAGLDPLS